MDRINDKTDQIINNLISLYTPIFFLHPKEPFRPISVGDYMKTCIITPTQMKSEFNEVDWDKSVYDYGPLNNAPIYAFAELGFDEDADIEVLRIFYVMCYGYNIGKKIFGKWFGMHQCDFENVQVVINMETQQISKVFFSAHGSADGYWKNASKIQFSGTHPHVYVALNSHGCYHKPGNWYRIYFLANDYTKSGGEEWHPKLIRVYPRDDPRASDWVKYRGWWGWGPDNEGHVKTPDPVKLKAREKGTTWFRRLFCPCT